MKNPPTGDDDSRPLMTFDEWVTYWGPEQLAQLEDLHDVIPLEFTRSVSATDAEIG